MLSIMIYQLFHFLSMIYSKNKRSLVNKKIKILSVSLLSSVQQTKKKIKFKSAPGSFLFLISYNQQMITQIKPKTSAPRKKQYTGSRSKSTHQTRTQISNLINNKLNHFIKSTRTADKHLNTCLVQNMQILQSVPYSTFKKYQLQTTPRKTPRKEQKSNITQAEKIQPTLFKDAHSNRIEEWKSKFLTKKIEAVRAVTSDRFNRTHSLVSPKSLEKNNLGMKRNNHSQTISYEEPKSQEDNPAEPNRTRNQNNMAGVNAFMRKLKTKMQFYSLSSIISELKGVQSRNLSPNISSIDPKYYTRNQQTTTNRTSLKNTRICFKNTRSTKFEPKKKPKAIQFDCRPWSGIKGQINNDFSSIV